MIENDPFMSDAEWLEFEFEMCEYTPEKRQDDERSKESKRGIRKFNFDE